MYVGLHDNDVFDVGVDNDRLPARLLGHTTIPAVRVHNEILYAEVYDEISMLAVSGILSNTAVYLSLC